MDEKESVVVERTEESKMVTKTMRVITGSRGGEN